MRYARLIGVVVFVAGSFVLHWAAGLAAWLLVGCWALCVVAGRSDRLGEAAQAEPMPTLHEEGRR